MNLQGLYYLISTKRAAAGAAARSARDQASDPRTAYECAVTAERLDVEAGQMAEHAKGNEELMEGVMQLVNYLAKSEHKSRYRALCLTALEDAHNWLRRENGDREPESNFEIINDGPRPPLQANGAKTQDGKTQDAR